MRKKIAGNPSDPFLTLPEVQSYLGLRSRKTILKYIESGSLRAYKIGGTRWRIALQDVQTFLRHYRAGKPQLLAVPKLSEVAS